MQKINYVPLHQHTTFSIGDGYGYPKDLMDYCESIGLPACAITDHGNMSALAWQFQHQKEMEKAGKSFKSIYGIEAYYIDDIDDWKRDYDEYMASKKNKEDDDDELSVDEGLSVGVSSKFNIKERAHIVLLAMNDVGLKNLFSLASNSSTDKYFYKYPRIDFELLKKHNEGINSGVFIEIFIG